MKKRLVFYWYISPKGWNKIYDLHIKNLKRYKDVFDNVTFVVSVDETTKKEDIADIKGKIKEIFPNVEFVDFENNKSERESKYFYNEVALKLSSFPKDEAIFFAHNKGLDTRYVTGEDLNDWINLMYFANLFYKEEIDNLLDKGDIIAVGTAVLKRYFLKQFKFSKYGWIYAGTYFWFVPSRLNDYIKKNNLEIVPNTGRYYTEGFLGTFFPDDEKHCKIMFGEKKVKENFSQYMNRVFTEKNKEDFKNKFEK